MYDHISDSDRTGATSNGRKQEEVSAISEIERDINLYAEELDLILKPDLYLNGICVTTIS